MNESALSSMMDRNLECANRIAAVEERICAMSSQMTLLQGDSELAPRVAALVEALTQVAPKVMDHEACIQEMHQKVGHMDAKVVMLCDQGKTGVNEVVIQRLGMVETEIKRLCAEIDGTDHANGGNNYVA